MILLHTGTWLKLAVFLGYRAVTTMLIKAGASLEVRQKQGATALVLAITQGHE